MSLMLGQLSIGERITLGARIGVGMATLFLAIGVLSWLVGLGSPRRIPDIALFAVLYVAGGATTGALAGLLSILVRGNVSAFAVGMASSAPFFLAICVSLWGLGDDSTFTAVTSSVVMGGPCGVITRRHFERMRGGGNEQG